MSIIIVDALGYGKGKRLATIDVIGCGPRAIAGVLEKYDLNPKIFPANIILSKPLILENYKILFVSAMTQDLTTARKIRILWNRFSNGPAIIGGPIASDPYDALIRAGFQIAIIGEGEETLEELLPLLISNDYDPYKLEKIRGIAFKLNSELKLNPLRPIMDRDKFRQYKHSVRTIRGYPNYRVARVYVEVVRGCSNYYRTTIELPDGRKCNNCNLCRTAPLEKRYHCPQGIPPGCGYCSVPSLFGPSRSRSIEVILDEIEGLIKLGVRRLILSASDFLDFGRDDLVYPEPLTDPRNPPPNLDAIEALLNGIKSIITKMRVKVFVGIENVKPCLVNEDAARLLGKYLYGSPVHIGCETGSPLHAKMLGRPSSPNETLNAIKLLKKYGLRPYVYFIHGLPGQSIETAKETVKIMKKAVALGAEKITVYRFQPLPMSAFGNFSRAPPAYRNPASYMIWKTANEINSLLKKELIGKIVEAIITKAHTRRKKLILAYPFTHGPVIYLKNHWIAEKFINEIVKVKITGIISDRAVEGEVIEEL